MVVNTVNHDYDERVDAPYDISEYPPFAVTVDLVVFTIRRDERDELQLCAALVRRAGEPFAGDWALPGGFVQRDPKGRQEDLLEAAKRELAEETGLNTRSAALYLDQLRAYGEPKRDPRGNVVTVAYVGVVPFALAAANEPQQALRPGVDAAGAEWTPVGQALAGELAFDHSQILGDAVTRVRELIQTTSLALAFLQEPFTIAELRQAYEVVWGLRPNGLDSSNFHSRVLKMPSFVEELTVEPSARGLAGRGLARESRPGTAAHGSAESATTSDDSFGALTPSRGRPATRYFRRGYRIREHGLAALLERPITRPKGVPQDSLF